MTSTTAAGQRGFRHELLLHRSTQELVEFVVPMAREGVAAQEPTLLLVHPDTAEAVLHQVGPSPYLTVQPALTEPGRPALHVRAARPMLASYARVVHQEPMIPPSQWPEWRRLEAVLNLALSYHDTWAVCAYDRRALTDEMVADLHATHPLIAQDGGHQRSDRYQHPVEFLKHHRNNPPDPVEHTAPAVEVADPSPATARAAVAGFARHHRLPAGEIDNLVFATHEAVTNALMHGRPPTLLRLWAQPTGHRHRDRHRARPERPSCRAPATRPPARPRPRPPARAVAESPTRRRRPPPPSRRLHHPPRRSPPRQPHLTVDHTDLTRQSQHRLATTSPAAIRSGRPGRRTGGSDSLRAGPTAAEATQGFGTIRGRAGQRVDGGSAPLGVPSRCRVRHVLSGSRCATRLAPSRWTGFLIAMTT